MRVDSNMINDAGHGTVYIVGSGPGDPELLTIKAMHRIQKADVVVYDRLVSRAIISCAKPSAVLIYCGKAPGEHAMSQDNINRTLIRYASAGKSVVRLKGGDPFIFGRGGEEALALAKAGVPYHIIPGITSAIGASASAAIPLTHRGTAASFACITGTRAQDSSKPVRWDLLAHSVDTLAIYMGVNQLYDIQHELLLAGKLPSTPIAFIEQGTTSNERIITGVLSEMSELAKTSKLTNPALIIIGEVVRVRDQLHEAMLQARQLHRIG